MNRLLRARCDECGKRRHVGDFQKLTGGRGRSTRCVYCKGGRKKPKRCGQSQKCAVYVMRTGESVKIGISSHPERRRTNIQSAHPDAVTLAGIQWYDTRDDARAAELRAHRAFAKHRKLGEWFHDRGPVQYFADLLDVPRVSGATVPHSLAQALATVAPNGGLALTY